jgi:O-antigen/teichoic acid export membrane protein
LGIVISLLAHLLIPVVLPPQYATSLPFIDLMVSAVLISVPGLLAETYFRTQQNQRQQYQMRIAAAVVGVSAPAVLVIPYGAVGAAAGRLLANLIFSVVGVYVFWREDRELNK